MTTQIIDGSLFNRMVNLGAHHLRNYKDKINELNVFPVPDGDTGTNMSLSMTSGVNEMMKVKSDHIFEISNAFAKGLLMGARGNSGVILSQLFRGFAENIKQKEVLNTKDLANAFRAGVKTAYNSVTNPVEGTILTVAKDAANVAFTISDTEKDITTFMEKVVNEAKQSLDRTPSLLPILKEVGVVDSGGKGLLTIYEGFLAALTGSELPEYVEEKQIDELIDEEHQRAVQSYFDGESIEYGYCTEFIVEFESDKLKDHPFAENEFRTELSEHGDSLLVAADDELVKVHIHTEYPGKVMTLGQKYGSLINIDVENMRKQYAAIVEKEAKKQAEIQAEETDYAIVAVASGAGIRAMFESLGATYIIEGGQTMNPSTEDIVSAIERVNAKQTIVLPNNKNIILAAEQAASMSKKPIKVIPTKTVPQGLSALFAFQENVSIEENKENMIEASEDVKSGSVTYATRDTQINELTIKQNEFIGINDDTIKVSHPDKLKTAELLLDQLIDKNEDELLTVFFGEDITSDEEAQIEADLLTKYEDLEIEFHRGDQSIYSFIFMVE